MAAPALAVPHHSGPGTATAGMPEVGRRPEFRGPGKSLQDGLALALAWPAGGQRAGPADCQSNARGTCPVPTPGKAQQTFIAAQGVLCTRRRKGDCAPCGLACGLCAHSATLASPRSTQPVRLGRNAGLVKIDFRPKGYIWPKTSPKTLWAQGGGARFRHKLPQYLSRRRPGRDLHCKRRKSTRP
jgi:hypothetical protein